MKNYEIDNEKVSRLEIQNKPKANYMSQVNLDALIKRDDLFKIGDDDTDPQETPDFKELRIDADINPNKAWFFKTLKKPDFQRETSEWKPERIVGLVKSFIDGDIIPSIILWNWKGDNFIIDGGHRLSALIAWILNDYGDGSFSKAFFGEENITTAQKKFANATRALFVDPKYNIGTFSDFEFAFNNADKVTQDKHRLAKIVLVSKSIPVQWIKAKTSKDAEKSFFRINGESAPINETEALILKSREKPNAIAARAIIHAGNAHKYWGKFDASKQLEIEKIATKINKLLYDPELEPKVVHFPIAGTEYSAQSLELVFGIVNMINGLDDINFKRKEILKKESDEILPLKDDSGDVTIQYLNKVERIVSIISGADGFSLDLSPLVYFYSYKGRFQITSFFAIVYLVMKWDAERKGSKSLIFQKFCSVRGKFEAFLLSYKNFIAQATTNVGSGIKSYKRLADLFSFIIDKLIDGVETDAIITLISENKSFNFIKVIEAENSYNEERIVYGKKISKDTTMAVVINVFLKANILCPICGGRATFNSYNIDHITEKVNGGVSNLDNLQLTHHYCNEEKTKILELKA